MYALWLDWNLSKNKSEVFSTLRKYIKEESWERYKTKKHLIHKVWCSNEDTKNFSAFYLWETKESLQEEIDTMFRIKKMTGVAPTIQIREIEAVQNGVSEIKDITLIGKAFM